MKQAHVGRKQQRIPTPEYLSRVALHYLERYAASEASLRRVLNNRIKRAEMCHPEFAADFESKRKLAEAIDTLVAQHKKSGVINDAAFAEMKVNSLRRNGRSARAITQRLYHKGIAADLIEQALAPEDEAQDAAELDLKAARIFAKKRGMGPWLKKEATPELLRKHVAAMARAGFAFNIIKEALDTDVETVDDMF